jgi:hypothetical protein
MSKKRSTGEVSKETSKETKEEMKTEVKQEVKSEATSAKKAMFSRFGGPAPPPLRKVRGGGGGGKGNSQLSKVQGVVTRVSDKTFNQASGPVVKKIIDILVTNVIGNGSGDVVKTGIPGMDWIFPSSKIDSPETSESADGKFKAVAREINLDETQIRKLNVFSSSFYKEQKNGESAAGVASVDVGSLVEISGVSIDAVVKNGSTNFYRNAGKLTPLTDRAPSAAELGPQMIRLMHESGMQSWAAFQSSASAGGWFDTSQLNPEQVKQAVACQAMWSKVIDSTADRLAIMAQGKGDEEETYFKGHEERVRATNPAKLANGDTNLFLPGPYDKDIVPVLQLGTTPSNRTPGLIQKLAGSPEDQGSLPEAFAAQSLVNLEVRGKAVRLEMSSYAIYDRTAAVDALDKGENDPILGDPNQRIPFTVSLRDIGWSFGSVIEAKACMAASELLWSADFAAFPRMERVDDGNAESNFPEGGKLFLDVPSTLRKSALKISEKFVKDVLCGGLNAYIPIKQKADDVTKLDMPTGVSELPYLVEHAYEELVSGAGFNLENWTEEGTLEFYVVIEGVFKALSEDPELATSTDKAEAYLRGMDGLESNVKIRNFLASQALVYAVKA